MTIQGAKVQRAAQTMMQQSNEARQAVQHRELQADVMYSPRAKRRHSVFMSPPHSYNSKRARTENNHSPLANLAGIKTSSMNVP